MSLYITSLNSGSNGNCYYIGNDREAILIDAGLSCRETEKRMRRLGLSFDLVKAIFVSHEHDDHIKGIPIIAKKYQLPVYITAGTLENGSLDLEAHLIHHFTAYTPLTIGTLRVTAFPKFHDAADPHSFVISHETVSPGEEGTVRVSTVVGVFTDIGAPCEHLIRHFRQCHAAFLEANYDEEMLDKGSYPFHLKRRIRGGQGHLSNRQALELFLAHRPSFMSHLFLSHLSQNNNDPDRVQDLFNGQASGVRVVLAPRWEETAVYTIEGKEGDVALPWVETAVIRQEAAIAAIREISAEVGKSSLEVRKTLAGKSPKKQGSDPRQMSLF
ncbi:MAG TPA: MBL fold metallo-hydrolase [Puia sp.]|nr:MBL fold metallo-hydrolase [Puia sp.]